MRMGKVEEKPKKTIGRKSEGNGAIAAAAGSVAFPGMKPARDGRPLLPAPPKELDRAGPARTAQVKTLGRLLATGRKEEGGNLLTRALVRAKIAERLGGTLSPAGLATWARAKWLDVQRGAPAESGQREMLEDSLQSLALSTIPASRLSDDQLVELMTQLEG
jgi:3-dehydroquinate dehydratase-2